MNENSIKAVAVSALAAISLYLNQLIIPLAILLIVLVLDYISGITAAWTNQTLSSRIGIVGIVKKVSYLLVVVVGIAIDYVLHSAASSIGYDISSYYAVGLVVTIWLILNECISILENVDRIGVPLPSFLAKLVLKLKEATEKKGDIDADN